MPSVTLALFTNDLRLHDNPMLAAVCRGEGPVVAVYAFDPHWYEAGRGGFGRTGPHRARFLVDAVRELRESLAGLNIPLVVRRASPAEIVRELKGTLEIGGVHAMREYGTEEIEIVEAVGRVAPVTLHDGHNLVRPDDLPFRVEETPEVFTSFRTKVEGAWRIRDEVPIPPRRSEAVTVEPGEIPTVRDLTGEDAPATARFPAGEKAGLARLEHYLWGADRLRTYKETRNGMLEEDDSSKLSPYLSRGCLSPRRVYHEVRRYERERVENRSTYWLVFELLWRDYWTLILAKHGRTMFLRRGVQGLDLPLDEDPARFAAWREGRTGYTLVDAAMRELAATGYTSNRARQNVASLMIKNLGLDWRLGAALFERELVDHDVASNFGGWQYLAGIGNDPQGFRLFNPMVQFEKYDPEGAFAAHWLPELRGLRGAALREPSASERARRGYPEPVVPFRASGDAARQAHEKAGGNVEERPSAGGRRELRRDARGRRGA